MARDGVSATKTVLITGSNRGLGAAAARAFSEHRVLHAAREPQSGELPPLDLSSFASVRHFAASLQATRIDVVLHNAGILVPHATRQLTKDGVEETLQVNAVAPWLLTQLLRPALNPSARIVWVTSRLHKPGMRGAPVDLRLEDANLSQGYAPERAYKNSKLAVIWLARELGRRSGDALTSNAVCPGFVPKTAAERTRGFQRFLLRHVLSHMPFASSIDEAVAAYAQACFSPALDGVSGAYFEGTRKAEPSADARDPVRAAAFWAFCEKATT